MKIYLLPVPDKLQPPSQNFNYPSGNSDYGVEQDFLEFLKDKNYLTPSPAQADWHYLPVFWTHWHLNHNFAKKGVNELQTAVSKILTDPNKTFTICQYDDGPVVNLKSTVIFLASRKGSKGHDIPLLRNNLRTLFIKPRKRYLASFIGRLDTHPTRKKMAEVLEGHNDILISDGDNGQDFFIRQTLRSYIVLCPRGYGGSSFRFFEAMQLGVVPLLINSEDTRPFKTFIDWDELSLYVDDARRLPEALAQKDKHELTKMGKAARQFYYDQLQYGKWCNFVIKELELIK